MTRSVQVIFDTPTERVTVDGLDVEFDIRRTDQGQPDESRVNIVNLSEDHRRRASLAKTFTLVTDGEVLFAGDVARFIDGYDGTETKTTIIGGDGLKALGAHISQSIAGGQSMQEVIDAVTAQAGITQTTLLVETGLGYKHGRVLDAVASDIFDTLARTLNAFWTIQDGALVMWPKGGQTQVFVKLNVGSGLVGTPERIDDNDEIGTINSEGGRLRKDAYRVTSILVPQTKPGVVLEVESRAVTGNLVVRSVQHIGETRGNQYYTISEAELNVN